MSEITYLTPENTEFFRNKNGFLGLKFNNTEYPRVNLIKAFPFSYENKFISVRDKDQKEIGIIEDISLFSQEIQELFKEEIERRYYLPKITKIYNIKDEFGYSNWEVETNFGRRKFIIRRDPNNFINIRANMILIIDVDGNRYEIPDYTKLDTKSFKKIELLL